MRQRPGELGEQGAIRSIEVRQFDTLEPPENTHHCYTMERDLIEEGL